MKEIRKTTQFKRDFKKIKNDISKIKALLNIVTMLAKGDPIPNEFNHHQLTGNYKNHMECHIGNDFLLIWFDKKADVVKLVRLGTHSELFGKAKRK